MLIKRHILEAMATGQVSLAYRRWDKPAVKPGSLLTTAVGVLRVDAIREVDPVRITNAEAKRAGYADAAALRTELRTRDGATVYEIRLSYVGEDPRLELRSKTRLSQTARIDLEKRLEKMDGGKAGPWTSRLLAAIRDFPGVPAGELAARLGFEKEWLKLNVRKLKNLGLTISLEPGYKLSPRGRAFLNNAVRKRLPGR